MHTQQIYEWNKELQQLYVYNCCVCVCVLASQVVQWVQNPPAMQETQETWQGSILEWKRCPGGGHGNPLQYSSTEHPMDTGDWQTTVHRVTKSQTQLKRLSMHSCIHIYIYIHICCVLVSYEHLLST